MAHLTNPANPTLLREPQAVCLLASVTLVLNGPNKGMKR